jgi:signal transduction histidine kinase/DNA-binding response OmpR family regulator/ligand-binding sensor domain-containing protein
MRPVLLSLLFISVLFARANSDIDFRIHKISVREGLSNGRIHDVEQDSLGYLWFATANGLTRYSGISFKKYSPKAENGSTDPNVIKLIKHDGKLLALMQGGAVLYYDYAFDEWRTLFYVQSERFISIASFLKSKLLIGTSRGYYVYDLDTGELSEKRATEFLFIRKIEQRGEFVYFSTSKGIKKLKLSPDGSMKLNMTIIQDRDILDFEFDANNVLWIGTENHGLYRFADGETREVSFLDNELVSVRDIKFDLAGKMLLAVDRLGFYVLDNSGRILKRASYDPSNPGSLSQNSVNAIFVDSDNRYWLGIGEIGLNVLYDDYEVFKIIKHERFSQNTINNDIIRSIFQDANGDLWFGTEGGISILDSDGQWNDLKYYSNLVPVLCIEAYKGTKVVGTYGEGLLKFEGKSERATNYDPAIPIQRVYTLHVDDEFLWVGGLDGYVYKFQNQAESNRFSVGQVKAFAKRNRESLLVGAVEGIFNINPITNEVKSLSNDQNQISNVYALIYDNWIDRLWIGNDNGLSRYDFFTGEFTPYEDLSEVSGAVYSILQVTSNELWIAAEKGLFRYFIDQNWIRRYGSLDGLSLEGFGFGARRVLQDGRIAFGGPEGAVIFNPERIEIDRTLPKVYFSDILVNGTKLHNTIIKSPNFEEVVQLDYNQNNLEFRIDYIKYHGSIDYRLEWQLIGYDKDLKTDNNIRSIIYQDLKPGTYQLNITIINADGVRAARELTMQIEINPPIWLKWWAILSYLILAALLIYFLIDAYRARQDRKINDEKIKFFVDVAHDIRTPVSLIKLAVDQIKEGNDFEQSVHIINRYTKNLNDYVTELLDFQKSERKKLGILVTEYDLVDQVKKIVEDFNLMAEQKDLKFTFDAPDTISIWADSVQLGRVFNNLISNAIKYNHDHGSIGISIQQTEDKISVIVSDTGLGIPKNQIDQIFSRFHRADNALANDVRGTGIGLMLSKRIIELHKGEIRCESEENVGSTFTVHLLKGKAHFDPREIKQIDSQRAIERVTARGVEGKKTVLVIEDNKDILNFIVNSLSQDYFVLSSEDGREGLLLAVEQKPDLVISDVMLPGKNGKEICHIIKNDKKLSTTPVILLTALAGADDKLAGLEVGADYYLEKPFDIELLRLAAKNLLKKTQLDKEISDKFNIKPKVESPEESLLSTVVDIITTNLTNPQFSIDQLCDEVGLSRSNLFRKLKQIAGISPSDLIIDIKLNRAQNLLKTNPNARIDDVAYQSGFNDPRYFSTLFKKHFKSTPSDFQAKYFPKDLT